MARQDLLQTNFSAGELTPRLYGRVDIAKYADALKRARDVVLLQHGGARSRPGTDHLGEVKDSSKAVRLVPFVFSASDAYVLEMGDGYCRFWKNGALVAGPYEISTPFSAATVFELDFTQGADTMFLSHGAVPTQRLQRFGETRWQMSNAPFDPPPFDEIGRRQNTAITLGSAGTGATTATAGANAFLAADLDRIISYSGGQAVITGVTSATGANVLVSSPFPSATLPADGWVMEGSPKTSCTPDVAEPVGKIAQLTLGAAGWRADDVGRFVRLNGGLLQITAVTSDTIASARIEAVLDAAIAAEIDSWTLESPVWNAQHGYPCTMTLHQQRLVAAGTARNPQTVWGSRSGLYLDFTKGIEDDDSYSFELGSGQINPVRFLSSNRDLIVLTYGGEWTMSGGIEKPITPTNVRATPQAKVGAAGVRPEQVDDDLYYAQRGVSLLRTLGYTIELGGYQSGEASTLSDHLVRPGLAALSYQQSPERVLWALRTDGTYLGITVSREQQIRAFSLCAAAGGGVVESIATIPEGGEDRTYLVVRRTINGTTRRYVERMNWSAYQDCRVARAPAGSTITGLGHLVGRQVSVVADGVDLGDFTVANDGTIELPRTAATVSVGLRYTPTLRLLPPEFGSGMGASTGGKVNNSRTLVLFSETVGCKINDQLITFRQLGEHVVGNDIEPFSGWKDISDFGWEVDSGEVELTQPQSYPFCVLAVRRRLTSNPG